MDSFYLGDVERLLICLCGGVIGEVCCGFWSFFVECVWCCVVIVVVVIWVVCGG